VIIPLKFFPDNLTAYKKRAVKRKDKLEFRQRIKQSLRLHWASSIIEAEKGMQLLPD
jgi:hypothetical protein